MIITSVFLLLLTSNVKSLICPSEYQPCGSIGCYDPTIQGCINGTNVIQCINSCNGTCFSNSQYCYNNTKVCNNGELVCDIKISNNFTRFPVGLTCYNSSQFTCSGDILCDPWFSCGTQCINDSHAICANDNQTICYGFNSWGYPWYTRGYLDVCSPRKQCYDIRTSVCLDGLTVCEGLNASLCGENCFNPDTQICLDDTIECINSCNGTCYSNSQYCYNNTTICGNDQLVCDVKNNSLFTPFSSGLTCYDPTRLTCSDSALCNSWYACGTQCINDSNSVCANDNRTICHVSSSLDQPWYARGYMSVCGPQHQCYDTRTSICLGGIVACEGLNAQFCGGKCVNPSTQTCIAGNVRCINSCNGTCYSNSQYCHNNTKVCNSDQLVCDVKTNSSLTPVPLGLTCYDPTRFNCSGDTLCYSQYACGTQCLSDYNSSCASDGQTICSGFNLWAYLWYGSYYLNVCGGQKRCYDNRTSFCMDNNGTVCPIGSQICSGLCYDPQSQYCTDVNYSIYCLSNPSSSNCASTTSRATTTTSTESNRPTGFPPIPDRSNNNVPKFVLYIFAVTFILINKLFFDNAT